MYPIRKWYGYFLFLDEIYLNCSTIVVLYYNSNIRIIAIYIYIYFFFLLSASSYIYDSCEWFCNESSTICPLNHKNVYILVTVLYYNSNIHIFAMILHIFAMMQIYASLQYVYKYIYIYIYFWWVPLLTYMAVVNDFIMSLLPFVF